MTIARLANLAKCSLNCGFWASSQVLGTLPKPMLGTLAVAAAMGRVRRHAVDAVVVGSGLGGLCAAGVLAKYGASGLCWCLNDVAPSPRQACGGARVSHGSRGGCPWLSKRLSGTLRKLILFEPRTTRNGLVNTSSLLIVYTESLDNER